MKTILLLCGANEVGKTKTLKTLFGVSLTQRLKPMQLLKRKINGKIAYAVSLSSPQELSPFCNVEEVKRKIDKRIDICEKASEGQEYVLVIPFGIYQGKGKNGEINVKCIIEPIISTKAKGFKAIPIYLRKETSQVIHLIDGLMKSISKHQIDSDKDYARQARELLNIISKLE
jgi:hypothetical protein